LLWISCVIIVCVFAKTQETSNSLDGKEKKKKTTPYIKTWIVQLESITREKNFS